MIDTHCHLTFTQYEGQIPAELDRMREAGVRGCITVGTTSADSVAGLAIAQAHEGVWCSAGVHPLHSDEPVDWGALRACAQHPRCVAWGELGLDNHYATPGKAHQMAALEGQLDRMVRWREEGIVKPVIIHCRKAFDELLPMLAASGLPRDRFVFHCFSGSESEARRVLDFGAWISFTGIVTYRGETDARRPHHGRDGCTVPLSRAHAHRQAQPPGARDAGGEAAGRAARHGRSRLRRHAGPQRMPFLRPAAEALTGARPG